MTQIEMEKELQVKGFGPVEIASRLRIDRKTVRKYMEQVNFTPTRSQTQFVVSKLDPYNETILSWLDEDNGIGINNAIRPKQVVL